MPAVPGTLVSRIQRSIIWRTSALELAVSLNPLGAYDGLADEDDVRERLKEAELWLQFCDILQAPIL